MTGYPKVKVCAAHVAPVFLDAQKTANDKAEVLLVAVKSGDKTKIEAAFGDLGKNGCGGCHETFREKLN